MKARDVMVSPVITVQSQTSVKEVAKILLEKRISAVPVLNEAGKLVGMVSEGDLMHRSEAGTERQRPWWLRLIAENDMLAADYIKSHGRKVADIMTRNVITAKPDTPLDEIAVLLEKNSIKRVPIVEDGKIVGIVSRANLIQAVGSALKSVEFPLSDSTIRDRLLSHLKAQSWAHTEFLNVTVKDGAVDLWGITNSETERNAIRVAAETTPGVRSVKDNLTLRPPAYGM
jgi:CBS domain-containing protein